MKEYIRPSLTYVELRIEESLAGAASIPFIQENNFRTEQIFSVSLADFWLKIFRS